jgi:hypothetical protein
MRLTDLKENDKQLDEFLPAVGAAVGGIARGAAAVGSAALKGAQAVGGGLAKGAQAAGQASGLAGGQMDPAQAAQAAKDQQEQKKQIQDQIKQTQAQLTDLQKQLAELG